MRTHEAAEKWGITARRVRVLCVNGQINGAWREGKIWYIPDNAPKPADGRIRSKETLIVQIERKSKRKVKQNFCKFRGNLKICRSYFFFDSLIYRTILTIVPQIIDIVPIICYN